MTSGSKKSALTRSPNDGLPYFCKLCGKPYPEYALCGEGDCQLETAETAATRKKPGVNAHFAKKVSELKPGDEVLMHDDSVRTVKEIHHGFGLILKGDNSERPLLITWDDDKFTMVDRSFECQVENMD